MTVHARIQHYLDERGWTVYRLAKESNLSEVTIRNLFLRNTSPSLPTLEAICHGFKITLSQFFAEGDMVELTPDLKELFDEWAVLTPEQKTLLLATARNFNHTT